MVVVAAPPKKGAAVAAAEQKEPDYFGDKLKQAATYTADLGTLNALRRMLDILKRPTNPPDSRVQHD